MGAEQKRNPSTPEIILPKDCQSLPPVCQEGIRDVLIRLETMETEDCWAKIRAPEELKAASIPQLQAPFQKCMDALRIFKKESRSWEEALEIAPERAKKVARNINRVKAWDEIWEKVWNIVRPVAGRGGKWATMWAYWWKDPYDVWQANKKASQEMYRMAAGRAANLVGNAAAWETIKDQPGFGQNPFLPLLELYELGAFRIASLSIEGKEKLVADFPLEVDQKQFLGCLAVGDGEILNTETLYFHRLAEPCSQRIGSLKSLFTS